MPLSDGGCGITGYKIYVDDGNLGAFTEYDPTNVNNKPFLDTFTIDMTVATISGVVGNTYRIRIGAVNNVDEILSDSVAVILASVPSKPNPPSSLSDGSYIEVIMSPPSSDGGIPIISYQLQILYSLREGWLTVLGANQYNLQLTYLVQRNLE